jgi:hypothetical protein
MGQGPRSDRFQWCKLILLKALDLQLYFILLLTRPCRSASSVVRKLQCVHTRQTLTWFPTDPSLKFTKSLDLSFDGTSVFGGDRSKRYALLIENGAVKEVHIEPDNTGLNGN